MKLHINLNTVLCGNYKIESSEYEIDIYKTEIYKKKIYRVYLGDTNEKSLILQKDADTMGIKELFDMLESKTLPELLALKQEKSYKHNGYLVNDDSDDIFNM